MLLLHDRLQGVLFGLAAGDRIGGPVRMALQLAQSLVDKQAFVPEDVLARYVDWWQQEGFDTGPTADSVFELITNGTPAQEAVHQIHILFNRMTAGCNPAHRSAPLAMAGFLADDVLSKAAHTESALTHFDPLAGEIAAATVRLCRLLIRGVKWEQALNQTVAAKTRQHLDDAAPITLNRGGFAPDVLLAALYFVHQHNDFETALAASITFAGGANYCPVLVGAIGGARWGRTQISSASLRHALPLLPQIQTLSDSLALSFPSTD
jgi:ADP-ribosyl-[dinitrogen reductase] hydrolase